LTSVLTDGQGRFQLENAAPEAGEYTAQVNAPGVMAERLKLVFGPQPRTFRLKRGRKLAGRVVELATGYAIPGTEVRALDYDRTDLPVLTTRADADGRFEFTSLGDANYKFFVEDGVLVSGRKFRADGNTNVTLAVKLYEWSKAKPKPGARALR
jgi:hypothetical protein